MYMSACMCICMCVCVCVCVWVIYGKEMTIIWQDMQIKKHIRSMTYRMGFCILHTNSHTHTTLHAPGNAKVYFCGWFFKESFFFGKVIAGTWWYLWAGKWTIFLVKILKIFHWKTLLNWEFPREIFAEFIFSLQKLWVWKIKNKIFFEKTLLNKCVHRKNFAELGISIEKLCWIRIIFGKTLPWENSSEETSKKKFAELKLSLKKCCWI